MLKRTRRFFSGSRSHLPPYDWRRDPKYNPYYTRDLSYKYDRDNVDPEYKEVPYQCDHIPFEKPQYWADPGNPNLVGDMNKI